MIGSTDRVVTDCFTQVSGQMTSHLRFTEPRIIFKINNQGYSQSRVTDEQQISSIYKLTSHSKVTDPRRITKFSIRQISYRMTTKPTQYSILNRQKIGQTTGRLFIISGVALKILC